MAKRAKEPAGNPPALLQWLRDNLKRTGRHNMAGLAAVLGIHPSQVTRMMKDQRRVQIDDLPRIAAYLGKELPPGVLPFGVNNKKKAPTSPLGGEEAVTAKVQVEAVIAPAVWRELGATVALAERVSPSTDGRLQGMHQYACKIEADGRYAICVPFPELRSQPRNNDTVHVRRTRGNVYEDTLCAVRVGRGGKVELHLVNNKNKDGVAIAYPSTDPRETIELRGVVVGYFSPTTF